MKKLLFSLVAIAIIVLMGACSNDELFPETNTEKGRTLSLTASMPDDPNTRVSLTQEGKNIKLKWEVNDQIQLAFVQGSSKTKGTAKVASISDDGKKAQFDLVLPVGIKPGEFDLYGVFGGGGLDIDDFTNVLLSEDTHMATSLASVDERKDVMLTFSSMEIETTNPTASVVFKHLGSLLNITVKNVSGSDISTRGLILESKDTNLKWAYNSTNGQGAYNLVTKKFLKMETADSQIYFTADEEDNNNIVPSGEYITFWCWNPPLPDKDWPELKLKLSLYKDQLPVDHLSSNSKPAKTPKAGMTYYFYAVWDGTDLNFTESSYIPPLRPNEYYVQNGNLGAQLLGKEASITTLILLGELDKPDFEVMKKKLPNLTYVDLKNARCKNNLIPFEAFGNDYEGQPNIKISTIILPNSITKIEYGAFAKCTALSGNLSIPNGVTIIERNAYDGCTGLAGTLWLPDNLLSIGDYAFSNCSNMISTLTIPAGVTSIGENAFYNCSKFYGDLVIHDNITSIGNGAFYNCFGFKGNLTLPKNLTKIGKSTFRNCSGFTGSLSLPTVLTELSMYAFSDCIGFNGNLVIPSSLATIGYGSFLRCSGFNGTLTIPEGVKTIDQFAFSNCSGFTGALTIPVGVETIRESAFNECLGFNGTLTIPEGVKVIEKRTFFKCTGLSGALTIPKGVTSIGDFAFSNCTGFNGFLSLPNELISIGPNAFTECIKLSGTLTIPANVTVIKANTFASCSGFTGDLILHNGITSIEESAFYRCTGLNGTLTLPHNLNTIGNSAFYGCNKIIGNVVFPSSLVSIGTNGFYACSKVSAFRFPQTDPIPHTLSMLPQNVKVEVPTGAIDTYKERAGWKTNGYIFTEY